MKNCSTVMILLLAMAGFVRAQDDAPRGVPARLEATNGKVATVYLQSVADGKLTFRAGKKSMAAPNDKIKSLKFAMSKEEFDYFRAQQTISEEKINEIYTLPDLSKPEKLGRIFDAILESITASFNEGNLDTVVSSLELIMKERGQYMLFENNLQDEFLMLMDSYRKQGNVDKMRECASVLQQSADPLVSLKAKTAIALVALDDGDVAAAEKLQEEVDSEVVSLYLQAAIDRAKGEYKAAFQVVTSIIANHANDVDWLPSTELLSAKLYLDSGMTNSAALTARQVKNMYAGTLVAADAAQMQTDLEAALEEARAKAEAEKAAAEEAEKAAAEEASTAGVGDMNATTDNNDMDEGDSSVGDEHADMDSEDHMSDADASDMDESDTEKNKTEQSE